MDSSLLFNGSTPDRREFSLGNFAGTGAFSVACIARRRSDSPSTYGWMLRLSSSRFTLGTIQGSPTNAVFVTYDGTTERQADPTLAINEDEWYLYGISKASGTVAPRYHLYRYSTATWEHGNFDGPLPNLTSLTHFTWGEAGGESWDGNILIGAAWDSELADATFETLAFNLKAWRDAAPDEGFHFCHDRTIVPFGTGSSTETTSVAQDGSLEEGAVPAGWMDYPLVTARDFDDANIDIRTHLGTAEAEYDNFTIAVLARPDEIGGADVFECMIHLGDDGDGSNGIWFGQEAANLNVWINGTLRAEHTLLAAAQWQLCICTKAAGSSPVVLHHYNFSTDTWTHGVGSIGTASLGSTMTKVSIGENCNDLEDYDGRMAVLAIWDHVLTDAEMETLPDGLAAWDDLSPDHGWVLNQTDVAGDDVQDRYTVAPHIGWHETSQNGTAAIDVTDIVFDLKGRFLMDAFNRADEPALKYPYYPAPGNTSTMILDNNRVDSKPASGDDFYSRPDATTDADQFSEMIVGTGAMDGGPAVRVGANNQHSCYFLNVTTEGLGWFNNFSFESLGALGAPAISGGDVVRIEIRGTQIRCFTNGVEHANSPFTHSGLSDGGDGPGFFWFADGGVDDYIDNWKGGSLAVEEEPLPEKQTMYFVRRRMVRR